MTSHKGWRDKLADGLEKVAQIIRPRHPDTEHQPSSPPPPPPPLSTRTPILVDDATEAARQIHPRIGDAQQAVLLEIIAAHPDGISAGDISRAIHRDEVDVGMILDALIRARLVRKDHQVRPKQYHLSEEMLDLLGKRRPQ
jgi:hypothetical protein